MPYEKTTMVRSSGRIPVYRRIPDERVGNFIVFRGDQTGWGLASPDYLDAQQGALALMAMHGDGFAGIYQWMETGGGYAHVATVRVEEHDVDE